MITKESKGQGSWRVVVSTELAASVEEVFQFHALPENIGKITPWPTFIDEVKAPGPAVEGDTFVIRIREFGILPVAWNGRWRTVRPPSLLVDEGSGGPITRMRHEHRFEPLRDPSKCRMTDQLVLETRPRILAPFVALNLQISMLRRHVRTRALFS